MDREHVYEYLHTDSPREKYLNIQLRHTDFPDASDNLFTFLARQPVNHNSHNLPILTWAHALGFLRNICETDPVREHNVIILKQPQPEIPEHTHTYFEMIYIFSGSCVHLIHQDTVTLHAGDFCILPPFARHAQSASPDCQAVRILVHPSAFTSTCTGLLNGQDTLSRFLLDSIYKEDVGQYLLFRTGQAHEVQDLMLDMFCEAFFSDTYTDRILTGTLMILLLKLSRNWQPTAESAPMNSTNPEILAFLQENYATVTLENLAGHLHYTVPYCSRYIKKIFGCTFSQLLMQIRCQKSEQLLQNSSLTVSQISKMLGYENPENFMRLFKKTHHMTPSQYRNEHREKHRKVL